MNDERQWRGEGGHFFEEESPFNSWVKLLESMQELAQFKDKCNEYYNCLQIVYNIIIYCTQHHTILYSKCFEENIITEWQVLIKH